MNMDRETTSNEITPTGNLLVIESNGGILSRTVSQVYGRALLGALALRLNSLPFKILHESSLPQHESLTLDNIRIAAQVNTPRDNLIFINDNRKILSCRINPHYGIAGLENLQQNPEGASRVSSRPQAREYGNGNDHEAIMDSNQHAHGELHQPYADSASSSLSISSIPARVTAFLPNHILSSANRQPYDRDWLHKYNVPESRLNAYSPSTHKLDVLVRNGAVKVGDRLCVTYHPDSGPVDKFGEVLQSSRRGRLDLRIAPGGADFDGILHDCKSPKDIVIGMDREFQLERNSKISETWKIVNVVGGDGEEFGSLWMVRQAYQVFAEEMAVWGESNRRGSP